MSEVLGAGPQHDPARRVGEADTVRDAFGLVPVAMAYLGPRVPGDQYLLEVTERVLATGEPVDATGWRVPVAVAGAVQEFFFDFRIQPRRDRGGAVLVLHTDGLVERPGRTTAQSTVELAQVAGMALGTDPASSASVPDRACERVCQLTVELLTRASGHTDDVTVLAVQRVPETAPWSEEVRSTGGGGLAMIRDLVDAVDVLRTVDVTTAETLRRGPLEAGRGGSRALRVDLAEVTLLASAGVQVLFELADALALVAPAGSPAQHVLSRVGLPHGDRAAPL